jgi:hypothetical protein
MKNNRKDMRLMERKQCELMHHHYHQNIGKKKENESWSKYVRNK